MPSYPYGTEVLLCLMSYGVGLSDTGLFEFAKTGDKLWGWDFAAMVVAGRVIRVE